MRHKQFKKIYIPSKDWEGFIDGIFLVGLSIFMIGVVLSIGDIFSKFLEVQLSFVGFLLYSVGIVLGVIYKILSLTTRKVYYEEIDERRKK